ncbi:MAG: response regulator receiver protein [Selenomonadaceae bacterium]|nr:response regulator receiver protein [Selenomonadaceae bacterium]
MAKKKDARWQVVVIEPDGDMQREIAATLDVTDEYEFLTKYPTAGAAISQSSVFQPNLFLMDVEAAENRRAIPEFTKAFPGTAILGTMSKWSNDIAMECAQHGALGCILKPFTGQELTDSIRVFEKRGTVGPTTTIAFFSPKGRSGKSTLLSNLALHLAKETGGAVGIIDADLQFGDQAMFYDAEPKYTILEAVRDINYVSPITLEPYFMPVAKNLRLLCCPKRPEYAELIDVASLTAVAHMAQSLFRYVLIDLPFGYSPFSVGMCEMADIIYLVGMMNTGFEVEHMKKALGIFEGWSYMKDMKVIFSRVQPCDETERRKLQKELEGFPTEIMPNEYLLLAAANSGRMGRGIKSDTLFAKKIAALAGEILAKGATP